MKPRQEQKRLPPLEDLALQTCSVSSLAVTGSPHQKILGGQPPGASR